MTNCIIELAFNNDLESPSLSKKDIEQLRKDLVRFLRRNKDMSLEECPNKTIWALSLMQLELISKDDGWASFPSTPRPLSDIFAKLQIKKLNVDDQLDFNKLRFNYILKCYLTCEISLLEQWITSEGNKFDPVYIAGIIYSRMSSCEIIDPNLLPLIALTSDFTSAQWDEILGLLSLDLEVLGYHEEFQNQLMDISKQSHWKLLSDYPNIEKYISAEKILSIPITSIDFEAVLSYQRNVHDEDIHLNINFRLWDFLFLEKSSKSADLLRDGEEPSSFWNYQLKEFEIFYIVSGSNLIKYLIYNIRKNVSYTTLIDLREHLLDFFSKILNQTKNDGYLLYKKNCIWWKEHLNNNFFYGFVFHIIKECLSKNHYINEITKRYAMEIVEKYVELGDKNKLLYTSLINNGGEEHYSIICKIHIAADKYQSWLFDTVTKVPSARAEMPNGWLSWMRHTRRGYNVRVNNFLEMVSAPMSKDELIDLVNAEIDKGPFHRHSFVSFLLDELRGIEDGPWRGIVLNTDNKYTPF